MARITLIIAGLIVAAAVALADMAGVFSGALEHPSIEYHTRAVSDSISRLNQKLRSGEAKLEFEGSHGYLRSVLRELNVPVESQLLVFAKDSFQQQIINPKNPRALYFNDSVAAGWVRGGPVIELAALDPKQGVIFYTLDQRPVAEPQFRRRDDCLNCHESYDSLGVPGMLVRSVYPGRGGSVQLQLGNFNVDHRTPFEHRWGGWYVTGKIDLMRHMGNGIFTAEDAAESIDDPFDPRAYLSPSSDIVPLMVFDHQMHMENLLIRVGWEVRFAQYEKVLRPERLRNMANELVDYMLFVGEPRLSSPVAGSSGFAEKFAAQGLRDKQGRSLREFDLNRRLMKYPLSYMIYSPAFEGMPDEAREAFYKRLWEILSGVDQDAKYTRLSAADRRAIVEILRDTKTDLPAFFK